MAISVFMSRIYFKVKFWVEKNGHTFAVVGTVICIYFTTDIVFAIF